MGGRARLVSAARGGGRGRDLKVRVKTGKSRTLSSKLWLDRQLVYSCAYFATDDATLDAAQAGKLDHICRKLRLAPGERFLDIGCGWGALLFHAAERYGVDTMIPSMRAAGAGSRFSSSQASVVQTVTACPRRARSRVSVAASLAMPPYAQASPEYGVT